MIGSCHTVFHIEDDGALYYIFLAMMYMQKVRTLLCMRDEEGLWQVTQRWAKLAKSLFMAGC